MKILTLIPAYNEEKHIAEVARGVMEMGVDALVIDDGSTDNTIKVAKSANCEVLALEQNQGKGVALRVGFDEAIERGYDGVIIIDGDGQHDPKCIPDFVEALKTGAGLVIGSRLHDKTGMPPQRVFSNTVSSVFLSLYTGRKIADSQSGYRAFSCELLKKLNLTSTRYEIETEILLKAARLPFEFTSVKIPTIYQDETSHYRVWSDTMLLFKIIARDVPARLKK